MSAGTWDDLTAGLALLLTRRAPDDYLILFTGPYYVQCYQDPALLHAEATGNRPGVPEAPVHAEHRLGELGWHPPRTPGENWTVSLAFPVSHHVARRLAGLMTTTLREVYATPGPDHLRYEATNARTGDSWDAGSLGLSPHSEGVTRSEHA